MGSQGLVTALDSVHDLGPLIVERADAVRARGCLDDDVVDGLFETGLMRALVPRDLDGLDLTIPEVIEIIRVLSTYDASVGWTYAIGVGGPLAGRLLSRDAFETIFRDPRAMDGRLPEPHDFEGRRRRWRIPVQRPRELRERLPSRDLAHARGLGASRREARLHRLRPRVRRRSDSHRRGAHHRHLVGDRHARATGSNDCVIDDAFVPHDRVFSWFGAKPRFETGPFGRIPLLMQFGPGLAATAVGAARGAQKRFIALASEKRPVGAVQTLAERSYGQMAAGEAEGLILAAEDALAAAAAEIWRRGESGEGFDLYTRVAFRMRLVTAVRLAGRAVDLVHDAAGMHAIAVPSPLERAWRDVHASTQHVMLNVGRIEVAGRALLGLDPGFVI